MRVLRRHYEPLVQEIEWLLASRDEYQRLLLVDPTTLTDIERAARFLYLQRLAFGGKVIGRTFGIDRRTPARFDVAKLRADICALGERLSSVVVERLPYADVIRRYDGPETLFYLDPPYWGCEGDGFARADFQLLADQLSAIAGRFILSIKATDGAPEVFSRFEVAEVETTYTISMAGAGSGKRVKELIVMGQ